MRRTPIRRQFRTRQPRLTGHSIRMRTWRQCGRKLSMTKSDRSRTQTNGPRQRVRTARADMREDRGVTAKDDFLTALRAFREDSGGPPYRTLVRISRDLRTRYPLPGDVTCSLAEMSLTAVSEILAGKRKRLPAFDWTASFVLSCQRAAVEERVIKNDRGTTILPAWFAIRALHAADASADEHLPPSEGCADPHRVEQSIACQVTPDQQAFIAGHGPHGLALLARAQQGHPDARYRVALLLATDPEHTVAATALLIDVAATGHALSLDLLDAHPEHLSPLAAADRAHVLARAAQARRAENEALAFLRAAARGGAPGAAIEYAQALVARSGDPEAAVWLAELADRPAVGRHRHDRA